MSKPTVLLVDDQRDIVRLLHSTLQTLGHELDIIDAPSGEEALLEASRRKIDLLVSDYLLPGISGVELMHKIQARSADLKTIFISGMSDRRARKEMLNAGAVATFDKPIPLADFLDAVERALGLVRTIFPPEAAAEVEEKRQSLSELLIGFRQKMNADAVFLINDRGRVLARAGDLRDSSMEVSLLSALMAIFGASVKASKFIHQDKLDSYHVFSGGDHDLILIPVNLAHGLLLAGRDLASATNILQTVEGMLALRGDVEHALQSLGVSPVPVQTEPAIPASAMSEAGKTDEVASPLSELEQPEPEIDLDALFASANKKEAVKDVDAFWSDAVEKTGSFRTNPDVISFDEARKLGLAPGAQNTLPVRRTGPLRNTGTLKKK